MTQLALTGVLEHSFREHSKVLNRYIREHKEEYKLKARVIEPNRADWEQVWDRLAFAIISAHVPFDSAVKGLAYATKYKGQTDPDVILKWQMCPSKATYLNLLPLGQPIFALLKGETEPWLDYRRRLTSVKGLWLAKASFAASLLYPRSADLACIDTWMQKVYLGHTSFVDLRVSDYLAVEDKVRRLATRHGVCTFLAQWMMWDCARGTPTNHDIFPGGHKDDAPPF